MHDQLKDLGRSIVLAENEKDPGKRSRVWNHKEALDMMTRKKRTKTVEAICVDFNGISLTSEVFKKMPTIRFLEMIGGNLTEDFKNCFSELRWLSWKNCPSSLEATNVCPKKLLILDLSWTGISQDWNGWTQLKVATRLKVLNLSYCRELKTTLDLSAYLSLEILILKDCRKLVKIDKSIDRLRCLKHLNIKGCLHLEVLPIELGSLEALTELLMSIEYALLAGNSISVLREVPRSIGALMNLERLTIDGNVKITGLPDSIGMLKSLVELDVSCMGITELPNTIVNLKCLKVLTMNRSRMQKLPEGIGMLEKLERIRGINCQQLKMIPDDIGRLPSLTDLILTLTCVENVPELPQSLEILCLSSTVAGKAPEISNLVRLRHLELYFATKVMYFMDTPATYSPFCGLGLPSITSLTSCLGFLCCVKQLELAYCENLRHAGQLPSSLRKLTIRNCELLEVVDLSNLENLLELTVETRHFDVKALEDSTSLQLSGLEKMENLRLLHFKGCLSLQTLPNLSMLKNLKDLQLRDCPKLVEIEGLKELESLESLSIEGCYSLRSLPHLSHLKKLKRCWLERARVV